MLKQMFLLLCAAGLASCSSEHSSEAVALGRTKARVNLICQALDSYQLDHREMLKAEDGLKMLLGREKYLRTDRSLFDEWGWPIEPVVQEGEIVGAASIGKDGVSGTADDIACRVEKAIDGVSPPPS